MQEKEASALLMEQRGLTASQWKYLRNRDPIAYRMTYRINGLDPAPYKPLFGLSDGELAERGIVRMTVNDPTFPCRVSLTDRALGETLLLLNHVSHDVDNPFRAAHAIFVSEVDQEPARFEDEIPPVFEKRALSLRGFDTEGMMVDAVLVQPGEGDRAIRKMFENLEVETIHAHNAVRGCFFAKIERA